MARKPKKKLTTEQRRLKRERKAKYETVFINGKQKRVLRAPTINGLPVEEFIRQNADEVWLVQNEMWEYINPVEDENAENQASVDQKSESLLTNPGDTPGANPGATLRIYHSYDVPF